MPRGERPLKFPASLILREFYGTVTIRFEAGKVTHVTAESRRTWQYNHLPATAAREAPELSGQETRMFDGYVS